MMNEPLWANPANRKRAKKIGVTVPLLAISGMLGASLSVPRLARASSGHIILETIGISIAVGTVLGASTLPFYDQPGTHLMNLAYGASAGAVTGIGILLYGWVAGPEDEYSIHPSLNLDSGPGIARNDYVAPRATSPYPAQFWTPVVSLNW
jgi:hypothetical protein